MKEDCSEAPNAKTSEATDNVNNKGKSGELYWISSGKKLWFYELANLLEKLTILSGQLYMFLKFLIL